MRWLLRDLRTIVKTVVVLTALNVAIHFPYTTDGALEEIEPVAAEADSFYESAYEPPDAGQDSVYVEFARSEAHFEDVQPRLEEFLREYELRDARALEVGAGSGTLQDVVDDYTGLDIAASAERYFHKPFVHGSATDLPFSEGSFDLIWTIWTLEHVVTPEQGLRELRRVVRDGGYLYVQPAWNNPTWAPRGYWARDYADLNLREKIAKASLAIRESGLFKAWYRIPIRGLRWAAAEAVGPTTLRYWAVEGNFEQYWMSDSDALNSVDCFEVRLWFESRGDEVLGRGKRGFDVRMPCGGAVVVRVRKDANGGE